MGPSTVAPLEVERYVGASLISNRKNWYREPWAGAPISYRPPEDYSLALLAFHTGAPLILARNAYRKRAKNPPGKPVDTASVASDESAGSSSHENALPRIIKPRKRRKKERKGFADEPPAPVDKPCQCCDPACHMWDMDGDVYSFLSRADVSLDRFDSSLLSIASDLSRLRVEDEPPATRARPGRSGGLEVSTEIVTSPNGHRDLEIKFFSVGENKR